MMASYLDVHPVDPQPRLIAKAVALLRADAVIAYPTDSGYALGCQLGNAAGLDRIRQIRGLDEQHHFTLVCANLAQLGTFVQMDTAVFRAVKAATPGPYTFILPATREVPRRMAHPKKRSVGARIPRNAVVSALLRELGEPMVSSTLRLPGQPEPMTEGWLVKDELDAQVAAVIDSGECGREPTTVVDYTGGYPVVLRVGAGDPAPFQG
jgi:tRNA threonylcarbamoyl adenosine modification protein (Sua5/YciO/YrdC/YwlC family)